MADSLGRYFVYEMERRVRRILDSFNPVLDANGNESPAPPAISNFNVSNQAIDEKLNTALIAIYTEGIAGHEDLFTVTIFQDVIQDQISYAFPLNMLQLRWMRYKHNWNLAPLNTQMPGQLPSPSAARPRDYLPMYESKDPDDLGMATGYYKGPTWYRDGGNFILNSLPKQTNLGAIMMNIVALPAKFPITTPAMFSSGLGNTAVIQAPFALLAQESIIYDAALMLGAELNKGVAESVAQMRQEWHERFMQAIVSAHTYPSVNITSGRLVGDNYAGRPIGLWNRGNAVWV